MEGCIQYGRLVHFTNTLNLLLGMLSCKAPVFVCLCERERAAVYCGSDSLRSTHVVGCLFTAQFCACGSRLVSGRGEGTLLLQARKEVKSFGEHRIRYRHLLISSLPGLCYADQMIHTFHKI